MRTVADFVYIAQAAGTLRKGLLLRGGGGRRRHPGVPAAVWAEMAAFAWRELWVPGSHWARSLSVDDAINTPGNLLIRRADWGTGVPIAS